MRKRLFVVVAIALMLLVPSAVLLAQEKPACAKAKEAKEMKLTDEQKTKVQAFRMDQRMKAIDARAELQKQAIMLKKELMKDQPSMTDVEAILKKMSDARMKLQTIRVQGLLEMRKILGPDWKTYMKARRMGGAPTEMGEMDKEGDEGDEGEEMEAEGPTEMAPMAGCMGAGGPMGEGRKVIILRKGPGGSMEMGEMGGMGGCMGMPGMRGGCCMMHKEGKGRGRGSMAGGCMMLERGKGGRMGMPGMRGGCMMQKEGKGCGMGSMAGGCMKMGEMGGMGGNCMMMKGGKGCGMETMMGGCKMGKAGAKGSCSSMAGGWRHKSLYRPHFSGGSGCSMNSDCGKESNCSAGGAHKCSGKCKKEIKVEVETKQ